MRNVYRISGSRSVYPGTGSVYGLFHAPVFLRASGRADIRRAKGGYVALGLIGLPIFAAGGGIGYVLRPSFGYLLGFVATAFVTGALSERWKSGYKNYLIACLAGFAVTYTIGIAYKYMILNFYADTPATLAVVLLSCFPLDMPGDLILCVLASGVGLRLKKAGFHAG